MSRNVLVCALLVVTVGIAGCGSSGDKSAKKNGTTTTTFKFSGDDSKEFCKRFETFATTYTSASLDPASVPVPELAQRWAAAIAGLKNMEVVASSEIKGDVALLRSRIEELQPALAAVGYNPVQLSAADQARLRDKKSAEASDRISAYGTQVCKDNGGK